MTVHDERLYKSFEEWLDSIRKTGTAGPLGYHLRPQKIDHDVSTVLHVLSIDPAFGVGRLGEYTVMAAHNRKNNVIDLVVTYTGPEIMDLTVPLLGAVFVPRDIDGSSVPLTHAVALTLAPALVENLAKVVAPHLEFLKVVQLVELHLDVDPTEDLIVRHLTGTLGYPR